MITGVHTIKGDPRLRWVKTGELVECKFIDLPLVVSDELGLEMIASGEKLLNPSMAVTFVPKLMRKFWTSGIHNEAAEKAKALPPARASSER